MSLMRTLIGALIIVVALCCCRASIADARNGDAEELTRLQSFAMDPFSNPIGHSLVLGNAKCKLLERFGTPIREETRSRPDRTSEAIFTVSTLTYPGLRIVVGESSDSGNSWIEKIEITGIEYGLKYGLKIGAMRRGVIDALQVSRYLETEDQLHMTAYVWEERTDVPSRLGQVARVEGEIDVLVHFDPSGLVEKISIMNIAL